MAVPTPLKPALTFAFQSVGQRTHFKCRMGTAFPAGCELEGAADCVGLDGESCWLGVNVTANPAILDTVIVRLKQMLPC